MSPRLQERLQRIKSRQSPSRSTPTSPLINDSNPDLEKRIAEDALKLAAQEKKIQELNSRLMNVMKLTSNQKDRTEASKARNENLLQEKLDAKSREVSHLKSNYDAKIDNFARKLDLAQLEIEAKEQQRQTLEAKQHELEPLVIKLTQQLASLGVQADVKTDENDLYAKHRKIKGELEYFASQNIVIQAQRDELKAEHAMLTREHEATRADLAEVNKQLATYSSIDNTSELDTLKEKHDDLVKQLAAAQADRTNISKEYENLAGKHESYKTQMEAKQAQVLELFGELRSHSREPSIQMNISPMMKDIKDSEHGADENEKCEPCKSGSCVLL